MTRPLALAACALAVALLVPASGAPRAIKDGGTFRYTGFAPFDSVDPALSGSNPVLRPACGALMGYPNKPLPEGLRLAPELAVASPRVSKSRLEYTFVVRKGARFSTGAPVTAADVKHSLERILTPAQQSFLAYLFEDIVGARRMQSGKASALDGVGARGRTVTLRLLRPVPDLPARMSQVCVVPENLPVDTEGAKPPIPSAAPYYVASYVPGERIVLERNTFYAGPRPHHVDRIEGDFAIDGPTALRQVEGGQVDVATTNVAGQRLEALVRRYGVNRSRVFVQSGLAGRMFFLNTSRPLFRDNAPLRRAANLAVDRAALIREFGRYAATATDQYLPPAVPGFRNASIYPLGGPDLRRARALAAGHTRGGKAVLYTCTDPDYCVAPAQVLQVNLKAIGIDVQVKRFPAGVFFQKAATLGEPYDIIILGWVGLYNDPREFMLLFDGRTGSGNFSRFNSPVYNRLLDRAGRLSGAARYRAYGDLDLQLARAAAPAIPYAVYNSWAFVSKRAGCVVMNPDFDLTAVCLK
jgi:peptide/nickel transport system substrate-binding protein